MMTLTTVRGVESDNPRLLIVDDDPLSIQVLENVLGEEYEIMAALSGEEALSLAFSYPPDLIMMDISMPVLDGFEVCRRLKDTPLTRKIPVIIITALEGDENEMKGLALGARDYIQKPFNAEMLRLRVRNNMELKLQGDMLAQQVEDLRELHARLAEEMERVQVLSGLLPICCVCKKIRDGSGQWHHLESFISQHSGVLFSHGYCPECAKETLD